MKAKRIKRTLIRDEEGIKKLAECVKKMRKEKGLTQEELAHRSGLTLSQIARLETARINSTVSTIFRIARTLEIPVSDLFDFKLSK